MSYTSGGLKSDDPAVTGSYASRTAAGCCAYLIPHLKPGFDILDVGCGPGGITRDLARLCPDGKTRGVDFSAEVAAQAAATYCDGGPGSAPNLSYGQADAEDLSQFPDASFDVVHAHAVIMHLANPRKALKEFYRVCKPGGIVATRDTLNTTEIARLEPESPQVRKYWQVIMEFMKKMGGSVDVSERKVEWFQEIGFSKEDIVTSKSYLETGVSLSEAMSRTSNPMLQTGAISPERIQELIEAFREWEKHPNRVFEVGCLDVLCFKK